VKAKEHRKDVMAGLRGLKKEELLVKERDLTEQLFWLRMKHEANQLEEKANLKKTKRAIARIKSVMGEMSKKDLGKGAAK
jgi:ribosomal protein L29